MQVLNKSCVGSKNRGHNVILMTRRKTELNYIELKTTAPQAINGSLEVREGVKPEKFGTLVLMHDVVYSQRRITVICW